MGGIRGKKPRVLGTPSSRTPEEQFLIARIDGRLSVDDLIDLTGLEAVRVEQMVSKLAGEGAIALGDDPAGLSVAELGVAEGETASLADFAIALGMDPASVAPPARVSAAPKFPALRRYTPPEFPAVSAPAIPEPAGEDEPLPAEAEPEPEPEPEPDPEDEQQKEERVVAERDYRQVYESRWRPHTPDERCAAAKTVRGSDLLALCFDADSRVIAAILENSTVGLDHARLIAFHHRTGTGLEVLARRQEWLRDLLVERRLLRNPMIGDVVLGRVMASKRLLPTFKIATDRDIPELTRVKSRGFLRKKWQSAAPEDRADLLLRTEARCLAIMTGCTFDAKTTAILCGRPINSAMFVQSIAKFGASPPGLLAHLMKQPFVRKNAAFKKMLLAHPNMPGDVKRSV